MRVVNQSAQIMVPESPMKHIEKIGRVCYKSEDKIDDGTDRKFVKILYDHKHHAMLEHYRFILEIIPTYFHELIEAEPRHIEFTAREIGVNMEEQYCRIKSIRDEPIRHIVCKHDRFLISFNARALMELPDRCRNIKSEEQYCRIKSIRDELIRHIVRKYDCHELFGVSRDDHTLLSAPVNFIENNPKAMFAEEWRIHGWASVHMITDRGITHEIVRHREETSFAQESTRYCNYSKDKFGNEITVIDQGFDDGEKLFWQWACTKAEECYFKLLDRDITPQMARSVLPTCLKTEIVMTAPMFEWEHFFNLRMDGVAGTPHPLIKELSKMAFKSIREEFYGYC